MCRLRPFGFLLLAALGAIAALTGCEDEENNIVVPEQVITVSITADADSLASGGTARLIAVATTTAGDPLIFTWSAGQGAFTALAPTVWHGRQVSFRPLPASSSVFQAPACAVATQVVYWSPAVPPPWQVWQ